jgi:CO/xanthine dehydrogenase Mo-binding subunit
VRTPPAPAVAAAIQDAIGARLTELPFTAERVSAAIREREKAGNAED